MKFRSEIGRLQLLDRARAWSIHMVRTRSKSSCIVDMLMVCADEETEGFFDDEEEDAEEAAPSPSRRRSGLSMAAMEQQDSSFFGFEDPSGGFADDDVPWQSDEELETSRSAAVADSSDGWLEDAPMDAGVAERGQKASRAKAVSGGRRR